MPLLTPEQIAGPGTEHAHQAAFMQWIAIEGLRKFADLDLMFAIPNGGERSGSVAASMRAEGVKPGVPDLCLPVPLGPYAGLWIEFKKPSEITKLNGGRRDSQIRWHKRLLKQHYAVVVAYGWESAVVVVELYYGGKLIITGDDAETFFTSLKGKKRGET